MGWSPFKRTSYVDINRWADLDQDPYGSGAVTFDGQWAKANRSKPLTELGFRMEQLDPDVVREILNTERFKGWRKDIDFNSKLMVYEGEGVSSPVYISKSGQNVADFVRYYSEYKRTHGERIQKDATAKAEYLKLLGEKPGRNATILTGMTGDALKTVMGSGTAAPTKTLLGS